LTGGVTPFACQGKPAAAWASKLASKGMYGALVGNALFGLFLGSTQKHITLHMHLTNSIDQQH
jgi:hypothetical protein